MNAKKIMGAVLVALLAAALFIGAGAAATADAAGTVFVNQKLDKTDYSGNWVGPKGSYAPATVPGEPDYVYFADAGTYTIKVGGNTITLTVVAPKLVITGVAGDVYTFIPGDLYEGSGLATVYIENPSGLNYTLYFTGKPTEYVSGSAAQAQKEVSLGTDYVADEYKIQAEFDATDFVVGTTPEQLQTAEVIFNVVDAQTAATISAATTSVLKGDAIKLTISGQPGVNYNVSYENANAFIVKEQIGFTFKNISGDTVSTTVAQKDGFQFSMPAGGKATFEIKANVTDKSSEKITVKADGIEGAKKATITIEFLKGTISAKADAASYFVGDKVTITGTRTTGDITGIYLEGTNFKNLSLLGNNNVIEWEKIGENFEFTLDTSVIVDGAKKLDVGTYTLTLNASGTKATVPIVLKQPFISIVEAPEVIAQDTDAEFIINAEAADEIAYYIFGTNYFAYDISETNAENEDGEDILNQFVVELNETQTKNMDAGQYFAVFQHPMYDKVLNIGAIDSGIYLAEAGFTVSGNTLTPVGTVKLLFNVDERQTANAAQALCDALDSQNIDDMYVKYSFFVVGQDQSSYINEIPTEVVKGDKIVISGVDTANKDKAVVVEMISTAFAAVPKETVGSAAFIVATTTVADDGSWEITLDTSDLNVDEYSLSVAINSLEKKAVTVNVVEGADEPVTPEQPEQPEQPENPEEPVAPATPGFGALAALAGLGAVSVLLLRRE